MLLQQLDHGHDTVVDGGLHGVERQLGVLGHLVGLVDAGESLDDPGAGLLVEALDVPLLALLERRGHVDLEEGQVRLLVQLAGEFAVLEEDIEIRSRINIQMLA